MDIKFGRMSSGKPEVNHLRTMFDGVLLRTTYVRVPWPGI
jgi:hypothetical protein